MARLLVRGLVASRSASAQRLKAMAADRAATIATTIHITVRQPGRPPAASSIAVSAKGSAKIECSHLIISSVVRILLRRAAMGDILYSNRVGENRGGESGRPGKRSRIRHPLTC